MKNWNYLTSEEYFKVKNQKKCESCEGLGAVVSNDPEGNLEIQRCDDCKFFKSDQAARKVFTQEKLTKAAKKFVSAGKLPNLGRLQPKVRLPEEMGVN